MKKIWIIPVLLLSIGLAGCSMFGNDGDDDDDSFIVGYWVQESFSLPDTDVYEFASGGTCAVYADYAMRTVDLETNWSLSGDTLTIMGITGTITKVSENEFQWNTELGSHAVYYRKGYEPGGFALDGPFTELTLGTAYEGEFTEETDFDVFTVAVEDGASYEIFWEDKYDHGASSYSGAIVVSAYEADKSTDYFTGESTGYPMPMAVTASGTTIYIITRRPVSLKLSGTYSLKVRKVTP
ncbi:hypothetical protein [Sediminispirochaeta smaragdinae]|uniref:Lipocalin-like domain-containing protein n=1 Tax=Sediminispirochaeta smaragdinae (strain DSM 11293 / JCM 15392 / SEBR 4228) TaxID=573413 RepID=E1R1G4_SEDSS|nr:hypothetical protein [Sediminispirochaeta smaragdinae]ADK81105.1 hypothetical protein Spirs_1983 [Sediminispirochaeta smaragdinae DSM 11293]